MQDKGASLGFEVGATLGAAPEVSQSAIVVMKFGGSSVATTESWQTVAKLLRARADAGLVPVVVLSALKGVSTELENIASLATARLPEQELTRLKNAHTKILEDLKIADRQILDKLFDDLDRLAAEIQEAGRLTPQQQASVVAFGELLATAIGVAYLEAQGIAATQEDARGLLTSRTEAGRSDAQNFLSAVCDFEFDANLAEHIAASQGALVTQGFIASNTAGETVLLGREGSDTSAAYLAAKIKARRVEIWTDMPGMFSADPRLVPSAKLLAELNYDEAQELASTGSRILHPRCIPPLRKDGIPLYIRCTASPMLPGTTISAATSSQEPQVKGISLHSGVTLISMDGASMWQEVGFLAAAFAVFAKHGVSIDLVSTSESSVVVSIDASAGLLSTATLDALIADLGPLCRVRVIENCAIVSLVGRRIRAILARLAPALAVFEEEKIHLVSQAANDLNFSFVMDQDKAPRILTKLHASIIGNAGGSAAFGPSWEELFGDRPERMEPAHPWWVQKREQLLALANQQLSAYVYHADSVRAAAKALSGLRSVGRLLYAVKANFNADLLRILSDERIDFDCVSPAEVEHLRKVIPDLPNERILLTLNFAPRAEYEWALREGLRLTLDNLYPLQAWPELFADQELLIRLDPGQGYGHHDHVRTAGVQSKFGIPRGEVDDLVRLVTAANASVVGIHAHSGSGIQDPDAWRFVAEELVKVAQRFPEARILDLGGGFGVPEKPGDPVFDLDALDSLLSAFKREYPGYELWLEPGRYLVAAAGILLTKVTQTKGKGDMRYIGVGAGMNSLIRPALYGAYHDIVNLSRLDAPATASATVVGPICESGDKLGTDRLLPECAENDVMLIANAGAYGYVMGSHYNMREIAKEIVI